MTSGLVVADGLGPEGALCRNPEPIPRQSRRKRPPMRTGAPLEPWRVDCGEIPGGRSGSRRRTSALLIPALPPPPHSRPTPPPLHDPPPFTTRPRPCGGARMIGAKKTLRMGAPPARLFLPLESGRRAPVGAGGEPAQTLRPSLYAAWRPRPPRPRPSPRTRRRRLGRSRACRRPCRPASRRRT